MMENTTIEIFSHVCELRKYERVFDRMKQSLQDFAMPKEEDSDYYEKRGIGNRLRHSVDRCVYYNASDISEILGISISQGYKIIKKLNETLQQEGFITLSGKVPKRYFHEKYYGLANVVMDKKEET